MIEFLFEVGNPTPATRRGEITLFGDGILISFILIEYNKDPLGPVAPAIKVSAPGFTSKTTLPLLTPAEEELSVTLLVVEINLNPSDEYIRFVPFSPTAANEVGKFGIYVEESGIDPIRTIADFSYGTLDATEYIFNIFPVGVLGSCVLFPKGKLGLLFQVIPS